jgi:hypothetical protein
MRNSAHAVGLQQARILIGIFKGSSTARPLSRTQKGQSLRSCKHTLLWRQMFVTTAVSYFVLQTAPIVAHSYAGLSLVAGYLLQQGPEEDAFWTFASVMDMHLRGYFSSNPLTLEVDAALWSKALENNDAALAKKLLTQLSLPPPKICKPWLTSIFARALPTDYMIRVWDFFLCDGALFFCEGYIYVNHGNQAFRSCSALASLLHHVAGDSCSKPATRMLHSPFLPSCLWNVFRTVQTPSSLWHIL